MYPCKVGPELNGHLNHLNEQIIELNGEIILISDISTMTPSHWDYLHKFSYRKRGTHPVYAVNQGVIHGNSAVSSDYCSTSLIRKAFLSSLPWSPVVPTCSNRMFTKLAPTDETKLG